MTHRVEIAEVNLTQQSRIRLIFAVDLVVGQRCLTVRHGSPDTYCPGMYFDRDHNVAVDIQPSGPDKVQIAVLVWHKTEEPPT